MSSSKKYTKEELLELAQKFEQCDQYDMALKFYKKAHRLDKECKTAEIGINKARAELCKKVYYKSPANYKLMEGNLELRKGMLVFAPKSGTEKEYFIEHITNPRMKLGRLIFDYKGKTIEGYNCSLAKKWIVTLNDLIEGKYPYHDGSGYSTVEKYIHDNFTMDTVEAAATYFMDLTNCEYSDAKLVVLRILG